jgi:hypothetical protein
MRYSSQLISLIIAHVLVLVSSVAALAQTSDITDAPQVGSAEWFLQVLPAEVPTDVATQQAQLYGQLLPAVGRDDLWRSYPHRVERPGACDRGVETAGSIQERVADLARSTQIVIINEAHDIPWHRMTTQSLLGPLWDQGYRYLAAEAFSEEVGDYPDEEFGRLSAGYYTVDPTFGELIRTAKRLGYKLVPYEAAPPPATFDGSRSERIALREERQANHLMDRIFASDPTAKVIVHVGYSHAAEVPIPLFDGGTMPWMAARLKEKSEIDPLTIDQTHCRSTDDSLELVNPTNQTPRGAFDLAIAYPVIDTSHGRATWRSSPDKRLIDPPEESLPLVGRAVLEARYRDEPEAAIPVDRLLIQSGESFPLVLPAGDYRLTVFTEEDSETVELFLTVD